MSGSRLALAGLQGAGKTTLAQTYVDDGWLSLGIADPIKRMVTAEFGDVSKQQTIDVGDESLTVRELYQRIGAGLRTVHPDLLLEMLHQRLLALPESVSVVVDDVRTYDEAIWLHNLGFVVVLVETPEQIRAERLGGLVGADDVTEDVSDLQQDDAEVITLTVSGDQPVSRIRAQVDDWR